MRVEGVAPQAYADGGGDASLINSGARGGDNKGEPKQATWYKFRLQEGPEYGNK